jgi:hypothetical protein
LGTVVPDRVTEGWSSEGHQYKVCGRLKFNAALRGRYGFTSKVTVTDKFEIDEAKSLWQFILTDPMVRLWDQGCRFCYVRTK